MPSEAQMWTALRGPMVKAGLDPVRVENPALPGTPDVNYKEGWLELKHADHWPVWGGPLRLKHAPTPQQKIWLYRRWAAGGVAFLCLRVGREWFLFEGTTVRDVWKGQNLHPSKELIYALAAYTFDSPVAVANFLAGFKR